MRLICPNCDAQYDIADDVIPQGGRDVQCSSCAHTWFQTDKPKVPGRATASGGGYDTPTQAPQEPPRKPLDSSIADILREEAAHEQKARATDSGAPPATQASTQTQSVDPEETRKRIAQMAEEESKSPAAIAAAATGAVAGGSNLRSVPGIDEINETLRARAEASDTSGLTEDEKQEVVKRRGFRRGFFIVLLLLAILIAPYFFADQITENLPQLQGVMTDYVNTVDQIRLWLNEQVQAISGMIDGLMNGGDAPAADPAPTETPTSTDN